MVKMNMDHLVEPESPEKHPRSNLKMFSLLTDRII